MTGIEIKCLRESLHLSLSQLASITGVSERTIRYWESGRASVPLDVKEDLIKLNELINDRVASIIDSLTENFFFESGDTYIVKTYDNDCDYHASEEFNFNPDIPFSSCHRAFASRLANAIRSECGNSEIVNG